MKTNEIYNGDSYKLIKDIPDKSIDLIVTDPPYLIGSLGHDGILKRNKRCHAVELGQMNIINGFDLKILDEFVRVMKKINIYLWCNKEQIYDYIKYFVKDRKCNFEIIVWAKSNPAPFLNGHYLKDKEYCLYFWERGVKVKPSFETGRTVYISKKNVEDKKKYKHPTIKPCNIIENLIKNSCEVGGVILDPFSGSGTTCVCAKKLNRQYIGFEINEEFWKISKERLNEPEQLTLDI